jgi:hypothetical protein
MSEGWTDDELKTNTVTTKLKQTKPGTGEEPGPSSIEFSKTVTFLSFPTERKTFGGGMECEEIHQGRKRSKRGAVQKQQRIPDAFTKEMQNLQKGFQTSGRRGTYRR